MLEIEKGMPFEVYYTEGAATTKAGLQKFIAENPLKEIIIIDEIDNMPIQHQEGLLTMMEKGEFSITKVRNTHMNKLQRKILPCQTLAWSTLYHL
jgi:DNA-binding NtrC family response regulator